MGRYYSSTKTEADNLKKIDLSWLKANKILNGYHSTTISWTNGFTNDKSSIGIDINLLGNEKYAHLHYTQTEYNGDKKDFDYKIPIVETSCHYGGKRYWFICPMSKNGQYCGKRVRVLYKDGGYFACRHCYNLTYTARNENRRYKMFPLFNTLLIENKIEKLHEKIKRRVYAGKPTKKQQRLEQLYSQASQSYSRFNEKDMLL